MGLLAIAKAAARVGFAVAGDVKPLVTIKTGPTNTHTIATDRTAQTWAFSDDVRAIVYDGAEEETQGGQGAKKRTKIVLLQASDLTAAPTDESIAIMDGAPWEVAMVETDPAGATHQLTCRR